MTTDTTIPAVEKTVTVSATAARAFDLFTAGMNDWWPGHRHSVSAGRGETPKELVFEPRKGGAVYEITPDGTRTNWGIVKVWEPGERFEMTWHPGEDGQVSTSVSVLFEEVEQGCRVTLVHSGWERLGEGAMSRRDGYDGGWVKVLEDFRAAV